MKKTDKNKKVAVISHSNIYLSTDSKCVFGCLNKQANNFGLLKIKVSHWYRKPS